jgi:AcrR family transcriptional regulator
VSESPAAENSAERDGERPGGETPPQTAQPAGGSPHSYSVIWMRPTGRGRGPQPTYSRESIAAAAVRLADEQGFDAVSMRRVAAEIGAGTMSLYRYVPSKEDLLDLMIDQVSGELRLPEATGDVRADLLEVLRRQRALIHEHLWLVQALRSAPSPGPNALRYMDWLLSVLEGTRLGATEKFETIALLNGSVRSFVEYELLQRLREQQSGISAEQQQQAEMTYLTSVVLSGDYPHLTRVAMASSAEAAGAHGRSDPDTMFERLLERTLDGVMG